MSHSLSSFCCLTIFILAISLPLCHGNELQLEGMVQTPLGQIPIECMHEVPEGSMAIKGSNIRIRGLHNDTLIEPCKAAEEGMRTRAVESGWITWTAMAGNGFTEFSGYWTVPRTPTSQSRQTIFLFTGLQNSAGNEIIQPVLQWGMSAAGGGRYWTIASWWVTSSNNLLHSPLQRVNPGDRIYGTMKMTSQGNWILSTQVVGNTPTTLRVSNIDSQTMAVVTLEAYNVADCNQYPASRAVVFSGLSLKDHNRYVYPMWTNQRRFQSCQHGVWGDASTVTIIY